MFYDYNFFGMDLIWWMVWFISIVVFFSLYKPVCRKNKRNSPIDVLQYRFSIGEISVDEYERRKKILEIDKDLELRMFFLSEPYKN